MNEFIDPAGRGWMVAAPETLGCAGCAYDSASRCLRPLGAPDCHQIIWVRAKKAVRLTDEQINEIEVASWSGPGFGAKFNREAFARAIEAAVLSANGLERR